MNQMIKEKEISRLLDDGKVVLVGKEQGLIVVRTERRSL